MPRAVFFVVAALVAAVYGFGGVAGEGAWLGKALLVVFLAMAVVSVALWWRGRRPCDGGQGRTRGRPARPAGHDPRGTGAPPAAAAKPRSAAQGATP